jgi:hypothetical protein
MSSGFWSVPWVTTGCFLHSGRWFQLPLPAAGSGDIDVVISGATPVSIGCPASRNNTIAKGATND